MNTRSGLQHYDAPPEMKDLLERLRLQGEMSEVIHLMMVGTPETPVIEYSPGEGVCIFKDVDADHVFNITVAGRPERHHLVPMLHSLADAIMRKNKRPIEVVHGLLPVIAEGLYKGEKIWGLFVKCENAHAN